CFQKAKYWDQLPSLSSESKREDATARFLCRGFPYESSRGIPCSAYTGTYPIPGFKAPALRLPTPSGRNLKNSAQNLVRMEPGKIATHYMIARACLIHSCFRFLSAPLPGAAAGCMCCISQARHLQAVSAPGNRSKHPSGVVVVCSFEPLLKTPNSLVVLFHEEICLPDIFCWPLVPLALYLYKFGLLFQSLCPVVMRLVRGRWTALPLPF